MKQTILLIMIIIIMVVLSSLLKMKTNQMREKISPFECGFDPEHKMRSSFSLRFFLVTVLFLIFDIEIALILPIPLIVTSIKPTIFMFSLFLIFVLLWGGLLFEWWQGALNWK